MRIYSASSEETLRARELLKEWTDDGYLTTTQYQHLEKETASELRTTNVFLRLVLFIFTLISVGAAVALFFVVFLSRPSEQTAGIFLLIFAAVCYAAGELSVSKFRLYRYGIEEALAVCSVGFLCVGMEAAFFTRIPYTIMPPGAQFLVPAEGALFSLWIWHRFGFWFAFPSAMIFALFLPGAWTPYSWAQHLIVALLYVIALTCVTPLSSRHRFDYLHQTYSLAEAFLWLGIYLTVNLQLSSLRLSHEWWGGGIRIASEFPKPFYWTTWVLIWCLPPVILTRGLRQKDRSVIAVGAIAAILTFATNKPYLGWVRHTWDPMLLGVLLTVVALCIRRWLARGPGGIRHGFTAARLSRKEQHWLNVGSGVLGLVSPESVTPSPQTSSPDFPFGGGASGGGGASSDF